MASIEREATALHTLNAPCLAEAEREATERLRAALARLEAILDGPPAPTPEMPDGIGLGELQKMHPSGLDGTLSAHQARLDELVNLASLMHERLSRLEAVLERLL